MVVCSDPSSPGRCVAGFGPGASARARSHRQQGALGRHRETPRSVDHGACQPAGRGPGLKPSENRPPTATALRWATERPCLRALQTPAPTPLRAPVSSCCVRMVSVPAPTTLVWHGPRSHPACRVHRPAWPLPQPRLCSPNRCSVHGVVPAAWPLRLPLAYGLERQFELMARTHCPLRAARIKRCHLSVGGPRTSIALPVTYISYISTRDILKPTSCLSLTTPAPVTVLSNIAKIRSAIVRLTHAVTADTSAVIRSPMPHIDSGCQASRTSNEFDGLSPVLGYRSSTHGGRPPNHHNVRTTRRRKYKTLHFCGGSRPKNGPPRLVTAHDGDALLAPCSA